MERDEIRLECLKLAASRIPDHQECMARVRDYENYVVGQDIVTKQETVRQKKSGNALTPKKASD